MNIRYLPMGIASRLANRFGYSLVKKGLGYITPTEVVPEAKKRNLNLGEYLEKFNIRGMGVRREAIVNKLRPYLNNKDRIIEIGPGTGMFLEKTIELATPKFYEVYETSIAWCEYLNETYKDKTNLLVRNADGFTLGFSQDNSADVIIGHAVFVYLPLISTIKYLQECVRVCKKGGLIIFDCFTDGAFSYEVIKRWQADKQGYIFPVVISLALIEEFIAKEGLSLLENFDVNYCASESTYLVLQKN